MTLLLVSLILCITIAEITFRVVFKDRATPGYWPEENTVFIPELRRVMYQNITNLVKTSPEFSFTINTNSEGFRDHEHSIEKLEDTCRVLFLGDSFTFGYAVERNESFVRIFLLVFGCL